MGVFRILLTSGIGGLGAVATSVIIRRIVQSRHKRSRLRPQIQTTDESSHASLEVVTMPREDDMHIPVEGTPGIKMMYAQPLPDFDDSSNVCAEQRGENVSPPRNTASPEKKLKGVKPHSLRTAKVVDSLTVAVDEATKDETGSEITIPSQFDDVEIPEPRNVEVGNDTVTVATVANKNDGIIEENKVDLVQGSEFQDRDGRRDEPEESNDGHKLSESNESGSQIPFEEAETAAVAITDVTRTKIAKSQAISSSKAVAVRLQPGISIPKSDISLSESTPLEPQRKVSIQKQVTTPVVESKECQPIEPQILSTTPKPLNSVRRQAVVKKQPDFASPSAGNAEAEVSVKPKLASNPLQPAPSVNAANAETEGSIKPEFTSNSLQPAPAVDEMTAKCSIPLVVEEMAAECSIPKEHMLRVGPSRKSLKRTSQLYLFPSVKRSNKFSNDDKENVVKTDPMNHRDEETKTGIFRRRRQSNADEHKQTTKRFRVPESIRRPFRVIRNNKQ